MANRITKAERERLIETCRDALENDGDLPETIVNSLTSRGISHDRARSAVAKAQRRMRGEEVERKAPTVRYGVNLDDDSVGYIAKIMATTGINGVSAVVREALRRMAEGL